MSRREDVDNAVWSDEDFVELGAHAKLLYLWSFTNPRCGMAGIYRVMRRAMLLETGLADDELAEALDELQRGEFLFYDGRVMWVRSRVKHLRTRGSKIAASIRRDLDALGEHPFVERFGDEYVATEWVWEGSPTPSRNPSKGHPSPIDDPSDTHPGPSEGSKGRAGQGGEENNQEDGRADERAQVTYLRRPVPNDVLALAVDLLAEFDRQAGTTHKPYDDIGRPSESLRLVIGAVLGNREAITAESGPRLIAAVLAEPWWGGKPSVGVVFGPKVLERNLQRIAGTGQQHGRVDLAARRRALGYDDEASA